MIIHMNKKVVYTLSVWFTIQQALMSPQHACAQTGSYRISGIPYPLHLENKALSVTISGNTLQLVADSLTDMFRDPNVTYNTDNAPKLLFQADADFIFSCSIQHDFLSKWDGGALVLLADSMHWVKFCFEKDYLMKKRVVSVVTNNSSDDGNSIELANDKVYYKMARAGNVITLYVSENNTDWLLVRHFQFDTPAAVRVGFLAQSPTGKKCTVNFADIRYENKKIRDPYEGQ
jgi:regulation of enolase protein 1 (concanavalin A-like superfamily)